MQEINELKNLVVQSLESHGVLGQLRAQIRSSVFKVILKFLYLFNSLPPHSFNNFCLNIFLICFIGNIEKMKNQSKHFSIVFLNFSFFLKFF